MYLNSPPNYCRVGVSVFPGAALRGDSRCMF